MTELGKGRGAAPACAAQDERGAWRVAVVGYVVFCMVSVYLALLPEDVSAQERGPEILYLNSYHPGYGWSDQTLKGIGEVLEEEFKGACDLRVEYLDGKRFGEALRGELGEKILGVWADKYGGTPPDMVFVSDQDAYDLLRRGRDSLFQGVPVVFSGVEQPYPLLGNSTGMLASTDYAGNVSLILSLLPGTRRIVVVTDRSVTGSANRALFDEAARPFGERVEIVYVDEDNVGLEPEDILGRVGALGNGDVVFFLDYHSTRGGKYVDLGKFLPLLTERCPVPVFSHVDIYLGTGIAGGLMNSGLFQGRQLAGLGCGILAGEHLADAAPIQEKGMPIFDWRQLRRWGIDESRLPAGSWVLNRDEGLWSAYKRHIVGLVFLFLVQSLLIAALLVQIARRRKSESQVSAMLSAARRSEERFEQAVSHSRTITWETDEEGVYTYVSPSIKEILGYTPDDVVGAFFYDLFPEEYREEFKREVLARTAEKRPFKSYENPLRAKDGGVVWVLTGAAPILDEGGQLRGYCGNDTDITQRKCAEQEQERLREQLHQSQKIESVGRLAGGVAHDFNNMLGVIMGHTEMALERGDASDALNVDLMEIRKAAERSADLTRQLLAFARKQTVAPRVIDLNETVEGALKMLRRLIGEHIDLVWLPGRNLASVKIDPSQIDQILANLCVNARDAISDTGRISIETGRASFDDEYCAGHVGFAPGDYVVLTVSDNGRGMDKETLSSIFEPFFTTKELGKGTGLGLATVYGIVKQNDGFINVYSESGQGATFRVYLPENRSGGLVASEKASTGVVVGGDETILLVEDEPAILEMTATMLRRVGYSVLAASTPGKAIRLAKEYGGRIDLLMTDVVMPEMNGRELTNTVLSIHPGIRCLFMSGYTADVIAHQGVLDEGVRFIQKPFAMKDLVVKIRDVLGDRQL